MQFLISACQRDNIRSLQHYLLIPMSKPLNNAGNGACRWFWGRTRMLRSGAGYLQLPATAA